MLGLTSLHGEPGNKPGIANPSGKPTGGDSLAKPSSPKPPSATDKPAPPSSQPAPKVVLPAPAPRPLPPLPAFDSPKVSSVDSAQQSSSLTKLEEQLKQLALKQEEHIQRTDKIPNDIMMLALGIILLAVLSVVVIICLIKFRPQPSQSVEVDLQPLANVLSSSGLKLDALGRSVAELTTSHKNATNTLNGLNTSLPGKLVETLARAIKETPLGEIAQRCSSLESQLEDLRSRAERAERDVGASRDETSHARRELASVSFDRDRLSGEMDQLRETIRNLEGRLGDERTKLERANAETAGEKEVSASLRADAQKGFGHLAPGKLLGGELDAQIRDFYQQAMAGDVPAVAVWSALASFGAAQIDSGARDFQLQIVRRLGIVLAQAWKQKGLNEKARHEQLSVWAKHLNEHAEGRFVLFIPGLGTPVDRTKMACATSAPTVNEVLCWQVRNSAGANFSLAEVA